MLVVMMDLPLFDALEKVEGTALRFSMRIDVPSASCPASGNPPIPLCSVTAKSPDVLPMSLAS